MASVKKGELLPAGRYWVDVFEPQWPAFHDWLNRSKQFVSVITSELHDATPASPRREFLVFEVDIGDIVRWEGPGSATLDPTGEVTTSDDTVDKPEIADPLDELGDLLTIEPGTVKRTAVGLGLLGVVLGGYWVYRKVK